MESTKLSFLLSLVLSLLLSSFMVEGLLAQTESVSGVVEGPDGKPLPGANVVLKGDPTTGTTTGADGGFSLVVPSLDTTLIFSFVGYQEVEKELRGRDKIDVILRPKVMKADEVVVVGYGEERDRSDLTGSIGQVSEEDLAETATHSVGQLLEGKIPGLRVMNTSGEPGEGVTMRIRGTSSINGSNSPLYVVDGLPIGDAGNLKQINPQEIKSVEVLKDASAAAIYGSRGANGVILITTERGRDGGSPRVSFDTNVGVSTLARKPDIFTDPATYARIRNESRRNAGLEPLYNGDMYLGTYYPSPKAIENGQWTVRTDWADIVYRQAVTQNYTASVDGGDENTTYSVSGGYLREEGTRISNNYEKYSARLNIDQQVYETLNVRANINLSRTVRDRSFAGVRRSPVFPVYNKDGGYFKIGPQDYYHPVANAREVVTRNRTFDLFATGLINWQLSEGLSLKSQVSTKYGGSTSGKYEPSGIGRNGSQFNGFGTVNEYRGTTFINETYFNYDQLFGEKHNLNATSGVTAEIQNTHTVGLEGRGFVTDNLTNEALNTADQTTVSQSDIRTTLLSWIGRTNYTYGDRYLVTLTARADGSSKFGANNKWGLFPSGAVGWNVHNESFFDGPAAAIFNRLKLRVSYGVTGNQGISPYQTLDRLGQQEYYFGGEFVTGFGPGIARYDGFLKIWRGLSNPDLKWETTSQLNVGLEMGLWNDRISLTADYYQKQTQDLLRLKSIPLSSGFDEVWTNDGIINNRGIEVGLNADVLRNGPVQWNLGVNITHNENKVSDIGGKGENFQFVGSSLQQFRATINILKEGAPAYVFYGYETDGIVQTREGGEAAGLSGDRAEPGEIKYVDRNGDGVVDNEDRTVIGDPNPDFTYGANTQLYYRGFDFSASVTGAYGNDVYDTQKWSPSRKMKRWTPDQQTDKYPKLNADRSWLPSDWWVEDGSYLRLQNVTLGYKTGENWLPWMGNLRVYVNARNLLTVGGFHDGYDPAVGERGLHSGGYPRATTYTIGVNMKLK